jgi:hypothetical protein
VLEAIIKIVAFGKRYFKDKWNIFDFIVVTGDFLFWIIGQVFGFKTAGTASILRTLRIGRVFKLFKSLK